MVDRIHPKDRAYNQEELIRTAFDSLKRGMATAMVAQVVKFDEAAGTVDCQPVTNGTSFDSKGVERPTEMPLLSGVPVAFPGAGDIIMTFPVKAGDECLVVFAQRDFDGWWQTGKQSDQQSKRAMDLSDGIALFGINPATKAIAGISTGAAEMRNRAGTCKISMTPAGEITITAPGGLTIEADIEHTGDQTTSGTVTGTTDVVGNGTSLHTHTHGGVQTGSGSTGVPNP